MDNKELIERLMEEAGVTWFQHSGMSREDGGWCNVRWSHMAAFAALVAEECAKVCIETQAEKFLPPEHGITYGYVPVCADFVEAIRAKFRAP